MTEEIFVASRGMMQEYIKEAVRNELESFINKLSQIKEPQNSILTRDQTIELLNISPSTLYRWTKNKKLPAYGYGNKVYYKLRDVEACMIRVN